MLRFQSLLYTPFRRAAASPRVQRSSLPPAIQTGAQEQSSFSVSRTPPPAPAPMRGSDCACGTATARRGGCKRWARTHSLPRLQCTCLNIDVHITSSPAPAIFEAPSSPAQLAAICWLTSCAATYSLRLHVMSANMICCFCCCFCCCFSCCFCCCLLLQSTRSPGPPPPSPLRPPR